jgi:hypothetical protein
MQWMNQQKFGKGLRCIEGLYQLEYMLLSISGIIEDTEFKM